MFIEIDEDDGYELVDDARLEVVEDTRDVTRPAIDERRVHPRVPLVADVSLYSATNFWSGYTEDVSEGGLFVATYDVLPIGARIDLHFELPTGHAVKTTGEVRWLREASADSEPGMGVSFDALAPGDLAEIRKFVKHRSPLFFDGD